MSSTTPIIDNQTGSSSKVTDLEHNDQHEHHNGTGGFVANQKMAVQPPRQEDLQKSYASIVGNDANPKGWYGSMSMYLSSIILS